MSWQRSFSCVAWAAYLMAFLSLWLQVDGLFGRHGDLFQFGPRHDPARSRDQMVAAAHHQPDLQAASPALALLAGTTRHTRLLSTLRPAEDDGPAAS